MILVCGAPGDLPVALLEARLREAGFAYRFVNLETYPSGYKVRWTWDNGSPTGTLSGPEWQLDLAEISSVYVRYADSPALTSAAGALPPALQQAASLEGQAGLAVLLEQLPCPVVNRHNTGLANSSKPYQAMAIRAAGFHVPRSLITSDAPAARSFYAECDGEVIVKPLSGLSAIVRYVDAPDLQRLESAEPRSPIYLQAYVPGDNIRVHVVGDALFATLCTSNRVDYRHASVLDGTTVLEPTTLPTWVESACRRLSRSAGLLLSGIDLKRTPEGEYYCFEVNPSPVFSWYELQTAQAISSALMNLLARTADV